MKVLGLDKRPIKDDESQVIGKWFDEYGFSMDLVLEACKRDKNPVPSINYVNGILKSWHEKGIKSLEDIELLDIPKEKTNPKRAAVKKTRPATTTRFHNFEQRSDKYTSDDLEKMARRKRDAYSQRAKGEL